jgi:hypothetical protein
MEKNWTIHQLERKADDGFVINVHWRYSMTAVSETDKIYHADTYSVTSYTQYLDDDFIPYEDLTKEIVVGWVIESLGEERMEDIENSLIAQIEAQKHPPILTGLPWEIVEI